MRTKITTVTQFEDITGLKRGARKVAVDAFIKLYKIKDADLIADIYGSLGI